MAIKPEPRAPYENNKTTNLKDIRGQRPPLETLMVRLNTTHNGGRSRSYYDVNLKSKILTGESEKLWRKRITRRSGKCCKTGTATRLQVPALVSILNQATPATFVRVIIWKNFTIPEGNVFWD
ncbi:unnamed protein product [Hermetia illucens]|uniref:Uncharacterized protein n=1 Tax=Hermetia illucens TaxID=343691 RepID=A0A7R8UPZ6_HERIL|nr:unnamed protein product [Hermetia illucens]